MSRRTDINEVFDYRIWPSVQLVRPAIDCYSERTGLWALRKLGYEIVLAVANPAAI